MGNQNNKYEVIDWAVNRNYSKEHNISEWEDLPIKNSEYYDGSRFFKISRNLYPSYTRGWLYGYTEDADYWKNQLYIENESYELVL